MYPWLENILRGEYIFLFFTIEWILYEFLSKACAQFGLLSVTIKTFFFLESTWHYAKGRGFSAFLSFLSPKCYRKAERLLNTDHNLAIQVFSAPNRANKNCFISGKN